MQLLCFDSLLVKNKSNLLFLCSLDCRSNETAADDDSNVSIVEHSPSGTSRASRGVVPFRPFRLPLPIPALRFLYGRRRPNSNSVSTSSTATPRLVSARPLPPTPMVERRTPEPIYESLVSVRRRSESILETSFPYRPAAAESSVSDDPDELAPFEPPRALQDVARQAAERVADRLELFEQSPVLLRLRSRLNELDRELEEFVGELANRFQENERRLTATEDALQDVVVRLDAIDDTRLPQLSQRVEFLRATRVPALSDRLTELEQLEDARTAADAQRFQDHLSVTNTLESQRIQLDELRLNRNTDLYLMGILTLFCAILLTFIIAKL